MAVNLLNQIATPTRLYGAVGSTRAWILAQYVSQNQKALLVIAKSNDLAEELARDIETFATSLGNDALSVHFMPTWEHAPYRSIALSIRARHQRLACLNALIRLEKPSVFVTSSMSLAQATMPPELFVDFSLSLKTGASIDSRDGLVRRLTEAGYWKTDPVEDTGTFAVRGDIIDIFPAGSSRPVRIELFDDLVEKIREFDPESQRTIADSTRPEISIPPAREILINATTSARLRERIKSFSDENGVSRALRDPILGQIQDGFYPEHCDAWAPFAYEKPGCLMDYVDLLGDKISVVFDDEIGCVDTAESTLKDYKELQPTSLAGGLILPGVEQLFDWTRAITKARAFRVLSLEPLESSGKSQEKSVRVRPFSIREQFPTSSKHPIDELCPKIKGLLKDGFRVAVYCQTRSQSERAQFLLGSHEVQSTLGGVFEPSLVRVFQGALSSGFYWPEEGTAVFTESELIGTKSPRKGSRSNTQTTSSAPADWAGLQSLTDLNPGDLVVHVDHGIGRYIGLSRLNLLGAPSDYIQLEYLGKDKLYLPVYRLGVIQKYLGGTDSSQLDKLGGQQFEKTKQKVRDSVRKLAFDLVELYAQRQLHQGVPFSPRDADYREFEAKFPFTETTDQLKAIEDALSDMEAGKIMDRLVCGDVGYGKTEVAIRAAYCAVHSGKQVAVLVPTTILAHQHEESFRSRLKDYPIRIETVSRFKSAKDQKSLLADATTGKIDILIGTHRLLSRDVKFKDLGLIIIDEEHRFGVEHKEKLKTLKLNTHVLTLTATPIPRTLHMALSGLREISLITTPPADRLPIRTFVSKFSEDVIREAITAEFARGGQVFFVHNRVQNIYEIATRLREIVPEAKIVVGHGQMGEKELEETMEAFYHKKANLLLCTTIVESGLDIPSANTIIINAAENFGLAQLYQLRGRVGRSDQRAYAYLLVASEGALSETAQRRLETIQRFVELGSGFSIASHDLEIRGGGNLLGAEQSGSVAAVGLDLYTELLEEAIHELQGKPIDTDAHKEPEIKAAYSAFLDENYIPDIHQRLSLYRRLSAAREEAELLSLEEELGDRYGPLPNEAQNLFWMIRLKNLLRLGGVEVLVVGPEKVSVIPGANSRLDPTKLIPLMASKPKVYSITPDSKLVVTMTTGVIKDLYFSLESLFNRLLT